MKKIKVILDMYPDFGYPPQTILLQRLALSLTTGMSPTEQVMPVLGLKTSADLRRDDVVLSYPPTIKMPEIKILGRGSLSSMTLSPKNRI